MKIINIIALIGSVTCVTLALVDKDWTEAMAWVVITLYNTQNLIHNLLNNN
jgi:hypothetical protein